MHKVIRAGEEFAIKEYDSKGNSVGVSPERYPTLEEAEAAMPKKKPAKKVKKKTKK